MSLVEAKCTNCGAALKVDNKQDAAICEHCGAAFIIEKAINNYTINVYGSDSVFEIRAGILEKYNGLEEAVMIPDTVKKIGESAFQNLDGLISVVVPNSVTEIGWQTFSGCSNLKQITIPEGLNIGAVIIPADINSLTQKQMYNIWHALGLTYSKPMASGWFYKNDVTVNGRKIDSPKRSGCYIATAVYGSYDAPEVLVLRRFRDEILSRSLAGRIFIQVYYFVSPALAKWIGKNGIVRRLLDKLVKKLS